MRPRILLAVALLTTLHAGAHAQGRIVSTRTPTASPSDTATATPSDAATATATATDGAAPDASSSPQVAWPPRRDGDTAPRRWETRVHEVPRWALVAYPFALIGRGVSGGLERFMPGVRVSLLARGFFAFPAGGDYRSFDLGVSVEARLYVLRRGPFTRFSGPAPVGLFLGARVGVERTSLRDRNTERLVGTAYRAVCEGSLGYRFTIRGRVEFTPYVGAAFYSDRVRGVASTLRPTVDYGFSVGLLF